jgi:hypothetical protein
MRRIVAWFFGGIPFDGRSRRAIDETLMDWAHEVRQAPTRGRRAFATLQGALAVARVVSLSVLREAADLDWCRGLVLRFGLLAGVVALFSVGQSAIMFPGLGAGILRVSFLTTPVILLALLPPALLLILAWRPAGRSVPTAGAACLLAVASLVLAGWLVPLSSDRVNDLLDQSLRPMPPDLQDSPPLADSLPLPSAMRLHMTSWAWLFAAVVIFASKLARWAPLRSRWWLTGVPALYAAFLASLQFAIGTSFLVFHTAGTEVETPAQALALWGTAAALMVAAAAYRSEVAPPLAVN